MPLPITHIASLDVDAQNCFTPLCPDELPVPDGLSIVNELNAQATHAHYRIGSKDAHSPHAHWVATAEHPMLSPIQAANMDKRWPQHAVPGTVGFELIAGLPAIHDYDFFVWKGMELDFHPYSACYHDLARKLSTGLIEFLHQHKIRLIIVGGLATELCVKSTVLDLLNAGFNVIINVAACRGVDAVATSQALQEMQTAGAFVVHSANEIPTIINKLA